MGSRVLDFGNRRSSVGDPGLGSVFSEERIGAEAPHSNSFGREKAASMCQHPNRVEIRETHHKMELPSGWKQSQSPLLSAPRCCRGCQRPVGRFVVRLR